MLLLIHTGTTNVSTARLLCLKFRIIVEKRQKVCRRNRKFSVRLPLLEMSKKIYPKRFINIAAQAKPEQGHSNRYDIMAGGYPMGP